MLTKVTITGADDTTDIQQLIDLSLEFPFVEWGILVSRSQVGSPRFPSWKWMHGFSAKVPRGMNISTHMCGSYVRDLFTGKLNNADLPVVVGVSERVQLNTHAELIESTIGMFHSLGEFPHRTTFIFQWDNVNQHLHYAAHGKNFSTAALFDTSHGAGVLPDSWPAPPEPPEFRCGYAGGLGPDNVVEQVAKIEAICKQPYWIDMERRVRTEDDKSLDMAKVRKVLELMKEHILRG